MYIKTCARSCVEQISMERKRRKVKTLVIVMVRALLNARMSYYVNIIFIFFLFAEFFKSEKRKKKKKIDRRNRRKAKKMFLLLLF